MAVTTGKGKQFVYIVQASLEPSKCKIGITNNLERRLKEYNNITGKSKENIYKYLFTCQVKDMAEVENDIKEKFNTLREAKNKEIYFYNEPLFKHYVEYIKSHKMFTKEIFVKTEEKKQIIKIIKKTTPTLEERGLTRENIMTKAKKINNDEFYTRFEDVEKELSLYDKNIWKNKVVFCNCDDAVDNDNRNTSAFALYFLQNFQELELKKLICTHYAGNVDLFNQGPKGYIFTKYGFKEIEQNREYPKDYNGSFDHSLSIKILNEEADIVCTNPPFSRSIEYWDITISSGKNFLIISNIVNVLNTAYIPYFKDNKVWAGYNEVSEYLNHKREIVRAAGYWYTNIPIQNRPKHKQLKFVPLKDIPEKYKKYDDSELLLVDNNFIPNDYKRPFGVSARAILNGLLEKGYRIINDKQFIPYIKGKAVWSRLIVEKKLE